MKTLTLDKAQATKLIMILEEKKKNTTYLNEFFKLSNTILVLKRALSK